MSSVLKKADKLNLSLSLSTNAGILFIETLGPNFIHSLVRLLLKSVNIQ